MALVGFPVLPVLAERTLVGGWFELLITVLVLLGGRAATAADGDVDVEAVAVILPFVCDDTLAATVAADDVVLPFDVEDNDEDDEEGNELEEFTGAEEELGGRCCCCR